MYDDPALTAGRPAVVVLAVVGREPDEVVGRWYEATEHALAGCSSLGSWRIVTGSAGLRPQPHELVLELTMDVIILPSTVDRLVRAAESASARELPLGGESSACVLVVDGNAGARSHPEAAVVRIPWENATSSAARESLVVAAVDPVPAANEAMVVALGASGPVLLSVVMRTQGKRLEALRDSLLTLSAQSDGRFELLVVVHDADADSVAEVVADFPPWLTSRTRIVQASGGTRSVPLNVGIGFARGTHVAFLDDDDVVLGNWVSTFLAGALASPRRLLRAVAGVQALTATPWPDAVAGHVADAAVSAPYPSEFDLADHLRLNMTPFMALAFPRGFFEVFGVADESLEVCEDWDLLLRAASVLGVVDLPGMTAVYRRWSSGGDSYTTHDSDAWLRDMRLVRAKLDARPLILAPGSASELADLSALRGAREELTALRASTSWRATRPMRRAMDVLASLRKRR